jgi:hypothetical protein
MIQFLYWRIHRGINITVLCTFLTIVVNLINKCIGAQHLLDDCFYLNYRYIGALHLLDDCFYLNYRYIGALHLN